MKRPHGARKDPASESSKRKKPNVPKETGLGKTSEAAAPALGRRPSEGATETSAVKTVALESMELEVDETAAGEGVAKDTSSSTAESKPAVASGRTQKEKAKRRPVRKESERNGTKKAPKVGREGGAKAVKKKCKDKKPKNVKAEGEDGEDASTVCALALAEYGKKPYLRAPPTAYLDEKYITMPKRRPERPAFRPSESPEREEASAALKRRRCANCFATFASGGQLQSHLQSRKCSSLFDFDSDDEGCPFQTK
ncbi:zinc finger protein 654-like [Brachionichthys hirsutus]|uniref:zinc finger protein 654-like n=1 Tax=Brachionichthys hirsutus TaxID=412623 RepID=UPI00360531D2